MIKRKNAVIFFVLLLIIFNIFQFSQINQYADQEKMYQEKVDVTFINLFKKDNTTEQLADKLHELSQSSSMEDKEIVSLLKETSFFREDWGIMMKQLIHLGDDWNTDFKNQYSVNQYVMSSQQQYNIYNKVTSIQVGLVNLSLSILQKEEASTDGILSPSDASIFEGVAKEFDLLDNELKRLKLNPYVSYDILNTDEVPPIKVAFLSELEKHLDVIMDILDKNEQ